MKKKSFLLVMLAISMTCFFACEDDGDGDSKKTPMNKSYVGNWLSNKFYGFTGDSTLVLQQMDFTFTNTTFTSAISQSSGVTDNTLDEMVTIGGTIVNEATDSAVLDVSIREITLYNGASANRDQDAGTFDLIFNGALGYLLDADFSAEFEIYSGGDSMLLTIPVYHFGEPTESELRLGKQ